MKSKLFKFWLWRLEIKLSKQVDNEKAVYLANRLVKELNIDVDNSCQLITLWVSDKEKISISIDAKDVADGKYTGR